MKTFKSEIYKTETKTHVCLNPSDLLIEKILLYWYKIKIITETGFPINRL